jgi:hypothetical protein
MKVLIGWADNRTWKKFIFVHGAACRKGHGKLPGAS